MFLNAKIYPLYCRQKLLVTKASVFLTKIIKKTRFQNIDKLEEEIQYYKQLAEKKHIELEHNRQLLKRMMLDASK